MLVEKEIIAPGVYWYQDEATGLPRKLDVTPEHTQYWLDTGNKMLGAGLTIPVPYEHDFSVHPMTPKDKLLNNSGWVKEYRRHDGRGGAGDKLFGVLDIQDEEVAKKLPRTIRWTSPWINSFTDGGGNKWNNVISHLALTTRPRITQQAPFGSVAAALSIATPATVPVLDGDGAAQAGFCLTRAGRLFTGRKTGRLRPRYPVAFSMVGGGIRLDAGDFLAKKKAGAAPDPSVPDPDEEVPPEEMGDDLMGGGDDMDVGGLQDPLSDSNGDVKMEELLCDLLQALGVPMPDESNEGEFKRHLYEAAMSKIKELTSKGMGAGDKDKAGMPDQNKPPGQQPHAAQPKNPLIQQEQQPLYMSNEQPKGSGMAALSIDDINRIEDSTMRTVALAMFNENQALRAQLEANTRVTESLRNAKLGEAQKKRADRVAMLSRLSPQVKAQLDTMIGLQGMALSMGEDGSVVDPMRVTLDMLEAALAERVNIPRILQTDVSALSVQPHPTDADALSAEGEAKLVDDLGRMMGCPQEKQAS